MKRAEQKPLRSVSHSLILMLTPSHAADTPTFLHVDPGTLPSYFAHVGGVVWEFVCEVAQGHPVAMRLQLLHIAFVSELGLGCGTRHIGVNEGLFGSGGPRELVAVDLVRLGLDQAVHPQVIVLLNAHGDLVLIALCGDQQHWGENKQKDVRGAQKG